MRLLLALVLLAPLSACHLVSKASEALDRINNAVNKLEVRVEPVQKAFATVEKGLEQLGDKGKSALDTVSSLKQAWAASDLNSDNKIQGMKEWIAVIQNILIALGIGGGGAAAWLVKRNSASSTMKEGMRRDIDNLKEMVRNGSNRPAAQ